MRNAYVMLCLRVTVKFTVFTIAPMLKIPNKKHNCRENRHASHYLSQTANPLLEQLLAKRGTIATWKVEIVNGIAIAHVATVQYAPTVVITVRSTDE